MKKILYISILVMASVSLFAQTDKSESLISIKGSTINNIGEIKEIWETGSAIYISYENISFTNQFSYMFQTGYMQFKENQNYEPQGSDESFNIIPLQVGGRYYILINSIRPFLMAMSGVNIIKSNYPIYRINTSGEKVIALNSGTNVKINFQIGLGLAVKLVSNLQIEIFGNYNSHILEAPEHFNVTGFELGIGFNWRLN